MSVNVADIVATDAMSFSPRQATLNVGDTYQSAETLVVTPSNASRLFLFESSDESVATVDEDSGLVTAVGVGLATIDAISVYGDGYDSLTIDVTQAVTQSGIANFGKLYGKN